MLGLSVKQHNQTVNADAFAAGGGHTVFQGGEKVFVDPLGFQIPGSFSGRLQLKPLPLVNGVG